jgi:hypothetical protein
MKVWKIPENHLELLDQWRERVKHLHVDGSALIEKLIGIKPIALCRSGSFRFQPPPGIELPPYFTSPSEPYGLVSPKKNSKKGRELWAEWEKAKFEPISVIHLLFFLRINIPSGKFSYGLNEIGGQTYLVSAVGWNPENYGYEAVEV